MLKRLLITFSSLIFAWLLGFIIFLFYVPFSPEEDGAITDVIVVLTGSNERFPEGLALLEKNAAEELFISGVGKGVKQSELLRDYGYISKDNYLFRNRIILGHRAQDTLGNAYETAIWVKPRGYKSLRLVTSFYHIPRAMLEFEVVLPGIKIIPHATFPEKAKGYHWNMLRLLVEEYHKYMIARFRIYFMDSL